MDANKLRTGHNILLNDQPNVVLNYTLRPQSRGSAKMITKLKNLLSGAVIEKTFMSGEKLTEADISKSRSQYLYKDGSNFVFMDNETFEQFEFSKEKVGDLEYFLKDGTDVSIMKFNDTPINIELPPTIALVVKETEPGVRGDTASGGSKPAVLETGATVQVPFFINPGDEVVVNTLSGEYKERAK
ncbi:elongation factor P [Candidatus Peregrinibacteria bacterium]|jgi:elongation factor P|nr:elongation factor P [Candidatus Peregrinibacteria bacterium]